MGIPVDVILLAKVGVKPEAKVVKLVGRVYGLGEARESDRCTDVEALGSIHCVDEMHGFSLIMLEEEAGALEGGGDNLVEDGDEAEVGLDGGGRDHDIAVINVHIEVGMAEITVCTEERIEDVHKG